MGWRRGFAAELVKRAKAAGGGVDAWNRILTDQLKEALIAEQVLGVVVGQEAEMIRTADVEELWQDARRAARLL